MKLFSASITSILLFCCMTLNAVAAYDVPTLNRTMNVDVPHIRHYFYVGGRYQELVVNGTDTGQIKVDQIYVEQLTPLNVTQPFPLVFWTGNGQTGTNWLNTPDGRRGWASYFISKGYVVYLTDQPQRGRSAWNPYANDSFTIYTADYCEIFWTATQNSTNLWPQAALHTQFPGTGVQGDPTFDAYYASQVPALTSKEQTERLSRPALTALFDKIGPAFLVTHSQGGPHGFTLADSRPGLVKGLISIEPEGPAFVNEVIGATGAVVRPYGITITPVAYDPPLASAAELARVTVAAKSAGESKCVLQANPPRKLSNISKVAMLLVTSEAGYHSVYDYCTVEYLKQAGVGVDWLDLPTVGIRGNGHFMFMEKNNLDIAQKVEAWIVGKNA